jgi:hypothetical protein
LSVADTQYSAQRDGLEFISIKLSAAKGEEKPGIREGTADVPHQIATAYLL